MIAALLALGCVVVQAGAPSTPILDLQTRDTHDPRLAPLLGVVSGPTPCFRSKAPDLTGALRDIGVTSIRNNDYYDDRLDIEGIWSCPDSSRYPAWDGCRPTDPGALHWESSDALFDAIAGGGFQMMLRLGGEWGNGPRKHEFKGPRDRTQEDRWIEAARKVVDRYQERQAGREVLTYIDIWTEWPGEHFWDRRPEEFIRFWARAWQELDRAWPDVRLGGPGFGPGVSMQVGSGRGGLALAFLTELYRQAIRPDWLGWHFFSVDPDQYLAIAAGYDQLLAGTGPYSSVPWAGTGFFDGVEVLTDAWGMGQRQASTDGGPAALLAPVEQDTMYNRGRGAALLTAGWIALQHTDVQGAWLYRAGDPASDPTAPPGSTARRQAGGPGLFWGDAAATPKPSAHAFRLWSRMVAEFPDKLDVGPKVGELWVLAGTGSDGRKGVLVANPTGGALRWQAPGARGRLFVVDDVRDGRTAEAWAGGPVEVAGGTVQLLVVEPTGPVRRPGTSDSE